jgi:hypothetical protein
MRRLSWFFVFAFMAYACQLQNADESVLSPEGLKSGAVMQEPEVCGQVMIFDLKASASQLLVGTIQVSNNDDYLFVEFIAKEGETFFDSHLNISCTEPDGRGSPGNYNANGYLETSTDTYRLYKVPKSFIEALDCDNACFYLLTHVATGKGETAMGNGCEGEDTFTTGSGSWFSYICYCWQECCKASGKVEKQLCEDTPYPLEGITVYFKQGTTERTAITDASGFYEFKNIGTGDYKIWVGNYDDAAPAPAEYNGNCPTTPDNSNLNFIYNFYSITGDVDEFVCDVEVTEPGPFTVTLSVGSTVKETYETDAAGKFFFTWLPAGTYTVLVPGATPVDVTVPGTEEVCIDNVDLRIDKYDVYGTLSLKDCETFITGVTVNLYSNDAFINSYVTDAQGNFEFKGLSASGPYEVRFTYKDVPYTYSVTSCTTNTITIELPCTPCYKDETAWSNGVMYPGKGGGWSTYTAYVGNSTVDLLAGQTMKAGTVLFSNPLLGKVTITITLNEGWVFADVMENVKIQDYATAPTRKPDLGSFAWKAKATSSPFSIEVPFNNFYGVHVDLWKIVPCPIPQ